MAGRARLTRPRLAVLAGLVAVVLIAHWLTIDWVGAHLQGPSSILKPMAEPMFTRVLEPEAPTAPPPPAAVQVAPAKPVRKRVQVAQAPASPASAAASAASAASAPPAAEPATQVASAAASSPAAAEPAAEPAAVASAATPSTPDVTPTTAMAAAPPASAPGAGIDSWPGDTRVNYRMGGYYRGDLHGVARVQWQRQDDRYQAQLEVQIAVLLGMVITSQGKVTENGLLPEAYEEDRRSGPRVVRFGDDDVTLNDGRKVPRPPGIQDTASQFVELSHLFSTGREKLEIGRSVTLWLARPGGIDQWVYDVVGLDTLDTPELGKVEAYHLKPRPLTNPRGNIYAEIWYAPSPKYLPVRVKLTMGEDAYLDLIVVNIEQR